MPIEAMVDLTGGLAERYELSNQKYTLSGSKLLYNMTVVTTLTPSLIYSLATLHLALSTISPLLWIDLDFLFSFTT